MADQRKILPQVEQQSSGRRQRIEASPKQVTLTPEQMQQRAMAIQRAMSQQVASPPFEQVQAQADPNWTPQHVGQGMRQPDGGPHEGFARRMHRVGSAVHPASIDYDRDGHADAGAGRSARSIVNHHSREAHAAQMQAAVPQRVDSNRDGYPDSMAVGIDGFRQDQIGYRGRLRARRVFNEQQEAEFFDAPQESALASGVEATPEAEQATAPPAIPVPSQPVSSAPHRFAPVGLVPTQAGETFAPAPAEEAKPTPVVEAPKPAPVAEVPKPAPVVEAPKPAAVTPPVEVKPVPPKPAPAPAPAKPTPAPAPAPVKPAPPKPAPAKVVEASKPTATTPPAAGKTEA